MALTAENDRESEFVAVGFDDGAELLVLVLVLMLVFV